jgi:hypothetical protein
MAESVDTVDNVNDPEVGNAPSSAPEERKSRLRRFLDWQPPKNSWYINWARRSKLPALKEAAKKDVHVLIR